MLSVLIPTYNYNSVPLVTALRNQLREAKIAYEIIVLDDASHSALNKVNEEINQFDFCFFEALNHNLGRSKIRNLLASKAKFNWLLFLDGDVLPTSEKFIENYLSKIKTSTNKIFCGGVKYQLKKENIHFLHYKHGKKNEEIAVDVRNKKPYKYFFTSNFLIAKEVFKKVIFEEKLTLYGREDLLFALNLKAENYTIEHIENAIFHLGIEDDCTFVKKTKQAMENLIFLEKENLLNSKETTLLNILNTLKKVNLSKFLSNFSNYFEKVTLNKKSLFLLNCLKVSYLCQLKEYDNE